MDPNSTIVDKQPKPVQKLITPSNPRLAPAPEAEPDAAPPCGICGCTDFTPHMFKPKKCTTCGHEHGTSQLTAARTALENLDVYDGPDGPKAPMDMKPWEREAVEQAARDKADKEETEARERGRAESQLTLRDRSYHPGRWVPWHKMIQGNGGFKRQKMGELWSCCLATDKGAAACAGPKELSDLHTPCIKCGTHFYPFELPAKCRSHPGKLEWRGPDATTYRWDCCDRLNAEEGCREFFKHFDK